MRARDTAFLSCGGLVAAVAVFLPLTAGHPHHRAAPTTTTGPVADISFVEAKPPAAYLPRPVRAATPPPAVVVQPSDTLSGIGTRLGRTWQQLAGWNHLTWAQAQNLLVGQVLKVPPAGYIPPDLPAPAPVTSPPKVLVAESHPTPVPLPAPQVFAAGSGVYSYAGLEALWENAGGPAWAATHAASIALCESGGRPWAHNPSGATGLWQILGAVVPGNLYDPGVNAANAVAKWRYGNGRVPDNFDQWVCQ